MHYCTVTVDYLTLFVTVFRGCNSHNDRCTDTDTNNSKQSATVTGLHELRVAYGDPNLIHSSRDREVTPTNFQLNRFISFVTVHATNQLPTTNDVYLPIAALTNMYPSGAGTYKANRNSICFVA